MPYLVKNNTKEVLTFSLNGIVNTLGATGSQTFTTNPASAELRALERNGMVTIEFVSDAILVLREKLAKASASPEVKKAAAPKKKKGKKASE